MKSLQWPIRFGLGLLAGLVIASVDNFAFGGEVSPIVIVLLLLIAAALAAGIWGRQGWIAAAGVWVCVPLAHLIKHVLGLPDTLHPNTYTSIFMLAAFTCVVTTLGAAAGALLHALGKRGTSQ